MSTGLAPRNYIQTDLLLLVALLRLALAFAFFPVALVVLAFVACVVGLDKLP